MRSARRIALLIVGWMCVIFGAAATPLPPPFAFGLVLLALGAAILSTQSKFVRRLIQRLRLRYPGWSAGMERAKARLPRLMHRPIERTAPTPLTRLMRRRRIRIENQ